jgi:hypothetical protein
MVQSQLLLELIGMPKQKCDCKPNKQTKQKKDDLRYKPYIILPIARAGSAPVASRPDLSFEISFAEPLQPILDTPMIGLFRTL